MNTQQRFLITALTLSLSLHSLAEACDHFIARGVSQQLEIFSVRALARGEAPEIPNTIKKIFVPNFEKSSMEDIKTSIKLLIRKYPEKQVVAYVPARKYTPNEAKELMEFFQENQLHELVLLAGGKFSDAESKGAFKDTHDFMTRVDLKKYGIQSIGVAGHPEYNPYMTAPERMTALKAKYDLAKAQGLEMYVLTQIVGNPRNFVSWQEKVRQIGIDSKIYYGIAIPEMKNSEYQKFVFELCQAITLDSDHPDFDAEAISRIRTSENSPKKVLHELYLLNAKIDGFHYYTYGSNVQGGLDQLGQELKPRDPLTP